MREAFFPPIINNISSYSSFKYEDIKVFILFSLSIGSMLLSRYVTSGHPDINKFFSYVALVIFSITFILMSLLICSVTLDNLYRPTIPQYPWNFWIDRFIPITFLFTPIVFTLLFNPFESWFLRFVSLLVLHIIVITPLLKKWSSLRRWTDSFDEIPESSWKHPRLYAHISIAMVYPLVWGVYFSLPRYLNLGHSINFTHSFLFETEVLIILLFLSPFMFFWGVFLINSFKGLRNYLWEEFFSLIVSIHHSLLANKIYFLLAKKVLFLTFLLDMLFTRDSPIARKYPRWDNFLSTIYSYPFVIPGIVFALFLIEFAYNAGNVYWSLYLLFFYPLFRGICFSVHHYACHRFTYQVCLADLLAGNWNNPKYPYEFWDYVSDSEFHFGISFIPSSQTVFDEMSSKYIWKFRKIDKFSHTLALSLRVRGKRSTLDLIKKDFVYTRTGNPRKMCLQLAARHYAFYGVRWTHTLAIQRPIHSTTAFFVKDPMDFITLIKAGWGHYSSIEKNSKGVSWPTPYSLYKPPIPEAVPLKPATFAQVVETNLAVTLHAVFPEVGTFSEMRKRYPALNIEANQACSDIVIWSSNKNGPFLLGIDQKASRNPGIGRNEALSDISEKRYRSSLRAFWSQYTTVHSNNKPQLEDRIIDLKDSSGNFEVHREKWSALIDKFEPNWRPPLRLSSNFQTDNLLLDDATNAMAASKQRVMQISDRLYELKVPPTDNGSYVGSEALFQDTLIQKILSQ